MHVSDNGSITRRQLLLALAGAVMCPASVRAQAPAPRIAIPFLGTETTGAHFLRAFQDGMRENGFGNVACDVRYAAGDPQAHERSIAELIAARPAAMVAAGANAVKSALERTQSIPILMVQVSDPVGNGFIDSLARPGRNVTGIASLHETVLAKMVELLNKMVPGLRKVGVLVNPAYLPAAGFWNTASASLQALKKEPLRVEASSDDELRVAFRTLSSAGVQGMLVVGDPFFVAKRSLIADLAARHRVPALYPISEHVAAGGLASYGPNVAHSFRRVARYAAQILRGARPGELAVEQPTNFELVINRKAAEALGIRLDRGVLLQADQLL